MVDILTSSFHVHLLAPGRRLCTDLATPQHGATLRVMCHAVFHCLVRGSLDSAQISEAEATEPRLSSDLEQSTLLQPPEPRRYYLLSEATIILPEL